MKLLVYDRGCMRIHFTYLWQKNSPLVTARCINPCSSKKCNWVKCNWAALPLTLPTWDADLSA